MGIEFPQNQMKSKNETTQCTELGIEKYLSDFMLPNWDFVV